jgi:hypothetical protein
LNSIQTASQTPLSIVIVGVGDADFTNMEKLDGDENTKFVSYSIKFQSKI